MKKKIIVVIFMLILMIGGIGKNTIFAYSPSDMITEWTVPANTTIKLPVQGTGLNIKVDWGDGSSIQTVTTSSPEHTYTVAGKYDITISGTCPQFRICVKLICKYN